MLMCVRVSVFLVLLPMLFHENENQEEEKKPTNVEKLVIYDQNAYTTLQSHAGAKPTRTRHQNHRVNTMRANNNNVDDE